MQDSPAELPQALMGEVGLRAELYAARNEARSLERDSSAGLLGSCWLPAAGSSHFACHV